MGRVRISPVVKPTTWGGPGGIGRCFRSAARHFRDCGVDGFDYAHAVGHPGLRGDHRLGGHLDRLNETGGQLGIHAGESQDVFESARFDGDRYQIAVHRDFRGLIGGGLRSEWGGTREGRI